MLQVCARIKTGITTDWSTTTNKMDRDTATEPKIEWQSRGHTTNPGSPKLYRTLGQIYMIHKVCLILLFWESLITEMYWWVSPHLVGPWCLGHKPSSVKVDEKAGRRREPLGLEPQWQRDGPPLGTAERQQSLAVLEGQRRTMKKHNWKSRWVGSTL